MYTLRNFILLFILHIAFYNFFSLIFHLLGSVITSFHDPYRQKRKFNIVRIKLEKENREVLERVLNGLRQDFKDGVLSKRQYLQRQQQILDKFEKGGQL